jgi:hypothetical protein
MATTIRTADPSKLSEVKDPLDQLMAAIIMAVAQIDQENLFDLVDQLVLRCGSIEAAVTAVKSGEVAFGTEG